MPTVTRRRRPRRRCRRRLFHRDGAVVPTPHTGTTIIGSGSSFAGPEVLQWTADTAKSPYNLTVDYTSTSSGDGRFNFGNDTVDFAVSDIPYQSTAFDTKQPTFPFIYVPVTAGGLAFMYHINGLVQDAPAVELFGLRHHDGRREDVERPRDCCGQPRV